MNILDHCRGPYKRRDQTQLNINTFSVFGVKESKTVYAETLEKGTESGDSSFLPLYLKAEGEKLKVQLPKHTLLKRATLFGWETVWNGQDAFLESNSSTQASKETFEVSIPAQGWWRFAVPSSNVDLYYQTCTKTAPLGLKGTLGLIKGFFTSTGFQTLVLATILHYGFFYFISGDHLKKWLDFTTAKHESPIEVTQNKEDEEKEAAANNGGAQEMAALEEVDQPFMGISLFKALQRQVEKNFKPVDVTDKLKNLGSLLKSPGLLFKKKGDVAVGKPVSNAPQGLGGLSLKSLQSGLLGKNITTPSKTNVRRGVPTVSSWKPQFSTTSGSGGKSGAHTLTDSEQQKLLAIFSGLQDQFRNCYETAVLKYDEMAVTVSFEGEITQEGRITQPNFKVSGRTTSDAQDTLLSCMKKVIGQIKVDSKLSGVKVKNQFIFKS